MRLLIVEDNPVSAAILKTNLKKRGFQILQAQNGKHALAMMDAEEKPVDIIISDIVMPEMDGFEMLQQLKQHPEWKKIPVIMCTGLSEVEDVKKAMSLGCKHYILKPINVKSIYDKVKDIIIDDTSLLLERLKDQEAGSNEEMNREIALTFSRLVDQKIKFLEEQMSEDTELAIAQKFSDLKEAADSFGTKWVTNILNRLEEIQNQQNGMLEADQHFSLLRELKKLYSILPHKDMSDEKITMVEQIDDFRKCIDKFSPHVLKKFDQMIKKLGYVKPTTCYSEKVENGMVAFDDVWATVGKLLIARGQEVDEKMMTRLKRFAVNSHVVEPFRMVSFEGLLDIDSSEQPAETKQASSKNKKDKSSKSLIDFKTAMEVVDGDAMLFQELFEDFLKAFPSHIDSIIQSIETKNPKNLQKEAHEIKGTASNLGLPHLSELAAKLESQAKSVNLKGVSGLTQQMKDYVAAVMVEFFDTDWTQKSF